MERHPAYGLAVPEKGWVPALRYALRRDRVLKLAAGLPPGPDRRALRALEIGCGAGALLPDLAGLGFACDAMETSESAFELATYVNRDLPQVRIHRSPQPDWEGRFDLLLAFEVLEHIEDDAGTLAQWRSWIRPGGRMLLSVPARMARWSPSDVWAGHFRRYERQGLLDLFRSSGFEVEHHECYGFPVSNVTERVRAWVHGRDLRRTANRADHDKAALAENTARSGTQRGIESRLYPLQASWPGTLAFRAACRVQERFLDREAGTGYLVLARRTS
jgi:SAM-dependent methyltransferase